MLPPQQEGTIVKVMPASNQVKINFVDEWKVDRFTVLPLARVAQFSDSKLDVVDQEAKSQAKRLDALPSVDSFAAAATPEEFKNLVFAVQSVLLRWFSRHWRNPLKAKMQSAPAVEMPDAFQRFAVPWGHVATQFAIFDELFIVCVLEGVAPGDNRIGQRLLHAFGLIRLLWFGYRVRFWPAALTLFARQPGSEGGQRLLHDALLLLEAANKHSCLACIAKMSRCDHPCCRQQLLLVGLNMGALTRSDGQWRVAMAVQKPASALPGPTPECAAPLPPIPMTWEKLLQESLPIAWPVTKPTRCFVRVQVDEENLCAFDDLAALLTVSDGHALRQQLSDWIARRADTTWLARVYSDTRAAKAPPKLQAYVHAVKSSDHKMSLFDLTCFCLLLRLDVWVIEPIWHGPPEFPVQLREPFARWKVPPQEIADCLEEAPQELMMAFVNQNRPLSRATRDTFVRCNVRVVLFSRIPTPLLCSWWPILRRHPRRSRPQWLCLQWRSLLRANALQASCDS